MNFLTRQLEACGQKPETLLREILFFIAREVVLALVIFGPIFSYFWLVSSLWPVAPANAKPQPLTKETFFLLVPFFIYLPLAVMGTLAVTSGWRTLARKFRAPKNFRSGHLFIFQNAQVGVVSFNNILNVRVAGEGLHLSLPFLFAFMHPPLLIPWEEIKAARQRKFLFRRVLLLTIGEPKIVTIAFPESRLTQAILPYVQTVIIEAPS